MNASGLNFIGIVRTIECDALKYPSFGDVARALQFGDAICSGWHKNIIPSVGLVAIVRRLCNTGLKANEGVITYGAVGTGAGIPSTGGTALATEFVRVQIASSTYATNVITIRTFFSNSQANGTLTEFGLFGEDASSVTDSGTMFEHVLISKVKTSAITLTIESQITLA